MAKYFYRVDFHEGTKERMVCGSSELDPTQFMAELSTAAFIRLDDLFYRDSQQRVHPWTEWDPRVEPTVFINCRFISSVMPFTGDPRNA